MAGKDIKSSGVLWSILIGILTFFLLIAGIGCDSSSSNGEEPYGPPSKTTHYIFKHQNSDGSETLLEGSVTGEKEIGGETFMVVTGGDPNQTNGLPPNEIYLSYDDPMEVTFAGGDIYSTLLGVGDATTPMISAILENPIVVTLDPPVGEPQKYSESGEILLGGQPMTVSVDAEYILEETSVSLETGMGIIHDNRYFTVKATAEGDDLPPILTETEITAEGWYSDSLGWTGAVLHLPPLDDVVLGLVGTADYGEAVPGERHMIQKMTIVDSANPMYQLSTYDVENDFNADKNEHAIMLLELRYIDEELAKTDQEPNVGIEFGTVFGYFPHVSAKSPISFFHPGEEGMGYNYWIAVVNEGAKNETENPMAFRITVRDNGDSPVRVTGRILYTVYKP